MAGNIAVRFSDSMTDIGKIHDALYEFNLRFIKIPRKEVHAEVFPEQGAFVAEDENGVFYGGIAFHWLNDPRRVYGDYFFVDAAARGQGLGTRIIEALANYAREAGAVRIDLKTNSYQAPGFYPKLGFRVTGEAKEPWPGCPDNIHYSLSLDL